MPWIPKEGVKVLSSLDTSKRYRLMLWQGPAEMRWNEDDGWYAPGITAEPGAFLGAGCPIEEWQEPEAPQPTTAVAYADRDGGDCRRALLALPKSMTMKQIVWFESVEGFEYKAVPVVTEEER